MVRDGEAVPVLFGEGVRGDSVMGALHLFAGHPCRLAAAGRVIHDMGPTYLA